MSAALAAWLVARALARRLPDDDVELGAVAGVGGHVAADLPRLVDAARAHWPALSFTCAPTLGEDARLLQAIADACARHVGAPPSP